MKRKHRDPVDSAPAADAGWSEEQLRARHTERLLDTPVAEAGLSVRTVNVLEKAGVFLLRDLVARRGEDLLRVGNFGATTMAELRQRLRALGLVPPPTWHMPRRRPPRRK